MDIKPEESFQWTVESPEARRYDVSVLIAGGPQIDVEIAGPQSSSTALLSRYGWDKVNASSDVLLPKGLSKFTARLHRNNEDPLRTLETNEKRMTGSIAQRATARKGLKPVI